MILKTTCIIAIFLLSSVMIRSAEVDKTSFTEATDLAMKGVNLSKQEAQKLEEEVKANPDNMVARTQLLGYYYLSLHDSVLARDAHLQHVLWIIQHHPDSEIAGLPYAQLPPGTDDESYYNKAKQLWLKQAETNNKNPVILGNAASFFFMRDMDQSERLFKEAQTLEPNNPTWSGLLGELYKLKAVNVKNHETKENIQRKSLVQLEQTLNNTTDQKQKFYLLAGIANAAFESNETEKSEKYAVALLDMSPKYKEDLYYGSAIHHGNIILGRIALKGGNVEKAKALILKAGETPGSPQINSFGPNMVLAKELLEKGERETVIEFLKLCRKFWKKDVLNSWIKEIEEGTIPELMVIMGNRDYY